MTDPHGKTASLSVNKISYKLLVNVRIGVPLCPECGGETVEVGRENDEVIYQCPTSKAWSDFFGRRIAEHLPNDAYQSTDGGSND